MVGPGIKDVHTPSLHAAFHTYLHHRPAHLPPAEAVLAPGGEEGRLAQEHPREGGEEDDAGEREEAEESVYWVFGFWVLGLGVFWWLELGWGFAGVWT